MRNFVLCCLVLLSASMFADVDTNRSNGVNNGLGAGGTVYKTWGFMYRHHFSSGFGVSTSLGGWLDRNWGHVGNELGLLYTLAHHEFDWSALSDASIRVYVAGYFANIYRRSYEFHGPSDSKVSKNVWESGLGAGPGLEFFFNRYFALHLELPWMTFVNIDSKGLAFLNSYPHIGGGLIYYF